MTCSTRATSAFSPTATDPGAVPAAEVTRALEICHDRLLAAPRIFIGYSGGLDSTVLLHAAHRIFGVRAVALHGNHGLHGDAGRWERHCRETCEALGVPLASTSLEVHAAGQGLEAAAREARFAWFREQLDSGDVLLLAHHQDDQAETLLLRLLRGAGPDGLGAMPRERSLGRGQLLRPFLDLPRACLVDYAQRHGLRWIDDPSNDDEQFDRNYLRRRVLPLIEDRWPAYRGGFARTAGLLREASALRDAAAPQACRSITGDPGFACADLPEAPAAAALAIRSWLRLQGLTMPGHAQLLEFLRQLREGRGASLATPVWTLERYRDHVYARARSAAVKIGERDLMPGEALQLPGMGMVRLLSTREPGARGEEDTREPMGRLFLRPRRGGERVATAAGRHRSVKTLLQELGVPPWWRDRLPLLFEARGGREELLAVGPYAAAPRLGILGLSLSWSPEILAHSD